LFSRFFFVFKTDAVWLDPSPKGNPVNLTDYFTTQSKKVLKMVVFRKRFDAITSAAEFNDLFDFLRTVNTFVSDDALCGKRLITFYTGFMIFTATG
jgi:hypothetical protein